MGAIRWKNPDARTVAFKRDTSRAALVQKLRTASATELEKYIDDNVTNMAQARAFLKDLAKVLALLVRE